MEEKGVRPTVATFGTLMAAAGEAGDCERVRAAWSRLQRSGLPAHVACINTYMAALCAEVGGLVCLSPATPTPPPWAPRLRGCPFC